MSIIIIVLISLVLLYAGISTGVLWTILGGLFVAIGNGLWELLKAIGAGIGSLLANILAGIGTGLLVICQAIALPVLIIGLTAFACLLIWKGFFS